MPPHGNVSAHVTALLWGKFAPSLRGGLLRMTWRTVTINSAFRSSAAEQAARIENQRFHLQLQTTYILTNSAVTSAGERPCHVRDIMNWIYGVSGTFRGLGSPFIGSGFLLVHSRFPFSPTPGLWQRRASRKPASTYLVLLILPVKKHGTAMEAVSGGGVRGHRS